MDDQTILDLIRAGKNDPALNALYRDFPSVRKLIRATSKKSSHSSAPAPMSALALLTQSSSNPSAR